MRPIPAKIAHGTADLIRAGYDGLFHARQARGMSRSELARLSGASKQQLSRLENGLIRLRLHHLKPLPLDPRLHAVPVAVGRYPAPAASPAVHVEHRATPPARRKPRTKIPGLLPARRRVHTRAASAAAVCRPGKCARRDATPTR